MSARRRNCWPMTPRPRCPSTRACSTSRRTTRRAAPRRRRRRRPNSARPGRRSEQETGATVMTDSHRSFFDELNWFDEEHCNRLDDELRWARAECPVVRTKYDGGMYIVTRYEDLRTVAE